MEEPPAEKPRLLLVDDERMLLEGFSRALGERFDVHVAGSAADAMVNLATQDYEAVLVDQHMPGSTGLVLLEAVQAGSPGTARVLMSGDPGIRSIAERYPDVVDGFLCKPATLAEIQRCVDRALCAGRQR